MTLSGLSSTTLGANDQLAVRSATANSMGLSLGSVLYRGSVAVTRRWRRLMAAEAFTVIALTTISVPVSSTDPLVVDALYTSLKTLLSDAVTSGNFTTALREASIEFGAETTADATADSVDIDLPIVEDVIPGPGRLILSPVQISIAVLGALIGCGVLFMMVFFIWIKEDRDAPYVYAPGKEIELIL